MKAKLDTHNESGSRRVMINDPQLTNYCKNEISTAKRYANVFFLLIALLQQIPGVSPTAIKEMIEDFKRHRADDATNNSKSLILRGGEWVETLWKELQVGDLVKVCDNQLIPADLILLASSEPQAMCYIETSNLDGETNLKLRQGLAQTSHLLTAGALATYQGWVDCEKPNRKLEQFVGTLRGPDMIRYPLKPNQVLLRGSSLKNTKWIFGLVIYTGKESKVMLNSTSPPLKRSTVEQQTNNYILFLFGVLLFLTLFTFTANIIWKRRVEHKMWYLDSAATTQSALQNLLDLITCLILYNTVIPISIPVMLEVVRFTQALYINWDVDMYDPDTDTPAMARTSNLNEELGQVRYLFSDKTGTLTRNVMEFKRCSIGGVIYGNATEDSNAMNDEALLSRLRSKDPLARHFFFVLAICHTVVPDVSVDDPDQPITYQASSPDEAALVKAASAMGFVFATRTPTGVSVRVNGSELHYEVLQVLEFTSFRKRMGVVVREPTGRIVVMVKGADTVIFERLAKTSQFREATVQHLEIFAKTGLRTLCIASAEVSPSFHQNWARLYYEASTALDNREERMEQVAELIETNLQLVGATAIEDKLQDGVPETIANLGRAGISIWVLTGDKQETAVNIGFSCRLLTPALQFVTLNTNSLDQTRTQLRDLVEDLGDNLRSENDLALIVDGHTLEFALLCECRKDFLDVALSCKSVICCRVSPWQKAELVKLVRLSLRNAVTLAIGDGANDVGMIQAAHVGVGISGKEGMQAACASDYAIGQFRFLNKLLLVHGAWNYNRLTKLILYSFYKNVCLYVIQFWFAILSGFSGQIVFERWTIGLYNVIFSAAPPIALGLFDRSCSVKNCLKYPELYRDTQASASFNFKPSSVVCATDPYCIPITMQHMNFSTFTNVVDSNGQSSSLLVLGNSVYTYVVVTVCLKAGLEHTAWTWISHLAIWGSVVCWFFFLLIYSHFYPVLPIAADMVGMDAAVFGSWVFWFGLVLIPSLCLTRDVAWKMGKRSFAGTLREQVMQLEQLEVDPGVMIKASLKCKTIDKAAFMRILRRTRGSEALLNLCPGASVGRSRTLSSPKALAHADPLNAVLTFTDAAAPACLRVHTFQVVHKYSDAAVFGSWVFWFGLVLIPSLCLTRDVAWKMGKRSFAGTLREQVMQLEQLEVDPGVMIKASLKCKTIDKAAFMRILRRTRGSEALLNLCPGASVGRSRTLSSPKALAHADHGYAFSQEEHGVVRQSDLIRAYDSTQGKPEGT
ncbi:unnamed protein product [Dicrocoelium dendriticum]|nr:unnamed protein product [Dicrocoelium dendriticum]